MFNLITTKTKQLFSFIAHLFRARAFLTAWHIQLLQVLLVSDWSHLNPQALKILGKILFVWGDSPFLQGSLSSQPISGPSWRTATAIPWVSSELWHRKAPTLLHSPLCSEAQPQELPFPASIHTLHKPIPARLISHQNSSSCPNATNYTKRCSTSWHSTSLALLQSFVPVPSIRHPRGTEQCAQSNAQFKGAELFCPPSSIKENWRCFSLAAQ